MKNLFITTFLLLALSLAGQDTKPTGTDFKQITSHAWGYNTLDLIPWLYKGSAYGWTKMATHRQLQHVLDSIGGVWEYEITVNDENNITTPLTLTDKTSIFYNGSAIKNSLWSGEGTTILNLNLNTYKYDNLILKQ